MTSDDLDLPPGVRERIRAEEIFRQSVKEELAVSPPASGAPRLFGRRFGFEAFGEHLQASVASAGTASIPCPQYALGTSWGSAITSG